MSTSDSRAAGEVEVSRLEVECDPIPEAAAVCRGLLPRPLWRAFALLTQLPRASGNEVGVAELIVATARNKGLEVRRDEVGNVVVVVPSTPGCERLSPVIVQCHMDMVCEKDPDSAHDFARDGLVLVREGDWIKATGTTLGADNGIGLAACLALLDEPPAEHGTLELLFTVDEERGLTGATNLGAHMITGRRLLNVDSEDEGHLTIGCAGGADHHLTLDGRREPVDAAADTIVEIALGSLTGGHSGVDIHRGRVNAVQCLAQVLATTQKVVAGELGPSAGDGEGDGLRIVSLEGGDKLNAITRSAKAAIAVPNRAVQAVKDCIRATETELRREHQSTDPGLSLKVAEIPRVPGVADAPSAASTSGNDAFVAADTVRIIDMLTSIPTGVRAWSGEVGGLVKTSANLARVQTEGTRVRCGVSCRSPAAVDLAALGRDVCAAGLRHGASTVSTDGYPGWAPNWSSDLVVLFGEVYARHFAGAKPIVETIHAGLECGVLKERFPELDMISFGPNITGAHSPAERLHIPSTTRFYALLTDMIQAMAKRYT